LKINIGIHNGKRIGIVGPKRSCHRSSVLSHWLVVIPQG
jgi:hypothetical protein